MENTQDVKTLVAADLRQSPKWSKYLEWLEWKNFVVNGDVSVEIMSTKIGGLTKIQHPRPLSLDDLKEIERVCKKNKALFIKLEPFSGQDEEILKSENYKRSFFPLCPPSTIYINLTLPQESLWGKITKTGRYVIRHSNSSTKFIKNPAESDLKSFYEIMLSTSKTQGFTIQSFEDLLKKVEVFGEESFLAVGYTADNQLAGGKLFLAHKDVVWYVHAGTNELGRKSDVGHKMMWDSFLYFKDLGYKALDMDGIDDPRFPRFTKDWGGFSFFKEKFGGEVVRFPPSYVKYLHPFFRFINRLRPLPL